MRVIIVSDGERYFLAELIGDTDKAVLLPSKSFKKPKNARRLARRQCGAGSLVMGKWQVMLPRGQKRFERGHLVTVRAST